MPIIINTHVKMEANIIAKLGYSLIVVTNPTVDMSVARKNTEYVIIGFIVIIYFLYKCTSKHSHYI